MDPNATLAALRDALDKVEDDIVIEDVQELFFALDEWLTRGGFFPSAWERKSSRIAKMGRE